MYIYFLDWSPIPHLFIFSWSDLEFFSHLVLCHFRSQYSTWCQSTCELTLLMNSVLYDIYTLHCPIVLLSVNGDAGICQCPHSVCVYNILVFDVGYISFISTVPFVIRLKHFCTFTFLLSCFDFTHLCVVYFEHYKKHFNEIMFFTLWKCIFMQKSR